MAIHGIVQGTVYRSATGALYDITGNFLAGECIACPACRRDAPLREVRLNGVCPHCRYAL